MDGLHHRIAANIDPGDGRFPQWSIQETRDFLVIRAELDQTFIETKRNKVLWEVVATKMKDRGYNRSTEQCKSKWKNLVTRYKGCETMEQEGMRLQFPFFNELQTIFSARMQRMLWMEAEGGASGSKKRSSGMLLSSEDEDENEESDREKGNIGSKKKRKVTKGSGSTSTHGSTGGNISDLKEVLEEFMKQQMQMEMEWLKAFEAREEERRAREAEWRQKMEALESERVVTERMWREREEQRRVREEARAERRDALITELLNRLRRDG
ncbi:hypothetical protein C3L33_20450, partial [Rhododendron williamsianum]